MRQPLYLVAAGAGETWFAAHSLIEESVQTVFCLASGRSGTHFLYEILRRNTRRTICRHEPYLWNPSMFGRPIYDHAVGDEAAVRRLAERKQRIIAGYSGAAAYAETSHSFLKSWADLAVEFFPQMKLVHLVRSPLSVAKSEANREELIRRWRLPFATYRGGDGRKYFRWALTGLEPIFSHFKDVSLSRFQWYILQWVEIENRAMQFLQKHDKHDGCYTVHSPAELNDPGEVQSLLDFLDLPRREGELVLKGRKNRTPGVRTKITEADKQEFAQVVGMLPANHLQVFKEQPYCRWEWANALSSSSRPTPPAP